MGCSSAVLNIHLNPWLRVNPASGIATSQALKETELKLPLIEFADSTLEDIV